MRRTQWLCVFLFDLMCELYLCILFRSDIYVHLFLSQLLCVLFMFRINEDNVLFYTASTAWEKFHT